MEFIQLRYFKTLVEEVTYTRAAMKLHISQPSLSTAIKKLENEIGFTLIDRTTRSSNLTKEGEILYQEAKMLINHFEHVSGEMFRLKKEGPLELAIGIIESTNFWLPEVLKQFKSEYQNVHIKLAEILSPKDVATALNNYEIHLALTNQYINDKEINAIPIYDEQLVALLPPEHPLQYKSLIAMKDFTNDALIICKEGFQSRTDILTAFRKAGVNPNIQFEVERFETACKMVEVNLGLTILPRNYVSENKHALYHIREIHDGNMSRTVYLAYMKNRYLPPIVNRFTTLVKYYFAK
jgi:DNA-binding transcriptional LysR family regulator